MSKKNLYLGIILILLIAAAYTYNGPWQDWKDKIGQPKNILSGMDIDQASSIEISKGGATVVLERSGDKWKVGGTKEFYVPKDKIDNLISAFKEAREAKTSIVSENPGRKVDFALDDDAGSRVKFYQADSLSADFIVGKITSDYTGSYISLPDDNKAYAVKPNLTTHFTAENWYDKTIFKTDKEAVNKIRFQYPTREFTMEKDAEGNWSGTLPYKFSVNTDKLDEILQTLANLQAVDIPEQTFANTGLEKNSIIVQVTGENIDNTLMVGGENENNQFFAKKGDSDNIYLITKEQRDILDKQIRDLR